MTAKQLVGESQGVVGGEIDGEILEEDFGELLGCGVGGGDEVGAIEVDGGVEV